MNELSGLRDIHLPPAVGWWPPAPGWWLLVILVIGAAVLLVQWMRRQRRAGYRRHALREARQLFSQWQQDDSGARYRDGAQRLLKRTAVAAYGRDATAALSGAAWLEFLDNKLHRPCFTRPPLAAWAMAYRPDAKLPEPEQIQPALEHWIRRHRC